MCACSLSVLIPCRNARATLSRTLDSVLKALPSQGEVIAVDDGSTDETYALLQDYAQRDARLKVLHQSPHQGVSAARNAALAAASGQYISFVDADDEVDPAFFDALTSALEKSSADLALCSFTCEKEGEKQIVCPRVDYSQLGESAPRQEFLPRIFGYSLANVVSWYQGRPLFENREWAYVWRCVYRLDVIRKYNLHFDEALKLNEDALFNASYALVAKGIACVLRPLYHKHFVAQSAENKVRRNSRAYLANKMALLTARNRLNEEYEGTLSSLYAATCVLSLLEMLQITLSHPHVFGYGLHYLKEYGRESRVREALSVFPISLHRPFVAMGVLFLRLCFPRARKESSR